MNEIIYLEHKLDSLVFCDVEEYSDIGKKNPELGKLHIGHIYHHPIVCIARKEVVLRLCKIDDYWCWQNILLTPLSDVPEPVTKYDTCIEALKDMLKKYLLFCIYDMEDLCKFYLIYGELILNTQKAIKERISAEEVLEKYYAMENGKKARVKKAKEKEKERLQEFLAVLDEFNAGKE